MKVQMKLARKSINHIYSVGGVSNHTVPGSGKTAASSAVHLLLRMSRSLPLFTNEECDLLNQL